MVRERTIAWAILRIQGKVPTENLRLGRAEASTLH